MIMLVQETCQWIGDRALEEIVRGLRHRQAAEVHSRLTEATKRARRSNKCLFGAKLDLKKCFDSRCGPI